MEREFKFRVAGKVKPRALERLDWSPFTLGRREVHPLRDVVLDTPDRALTSQLHALRVRRDGDTIYITLKGPSQNTGNGQFAREELEASIPEDAVADRTRWPEAIRSRVGQIVGEQALEPVVEVLNQRRAWAVRADGRLVAELALDEGEIRSGPNAQALHEIEIELKGDGTEQDLDELARRLQQTLPVAPEPRSKLERGLLLRERDGAPSMGPQAPLAEAGRAMLRQHWEKLRENEPGVRAGDHEAVHDMRVATRRLRAMLEVLGTTVYEPDETRRLRRGLKQVAAALGVVRDAEVWMGAVETYASERAAAERAGLELLLHELMQRRTAGRKALLAELDHKRTRKLFENLERFVTTEGAGVRRETSAPTGAPLRVRDTAGSALWSRLERVQLFEPVMPAAPLPALHELRIACKHLRYTFELFADALGHKGKRLRDDLVAAQDHLGALHDADVALPFVDELLARQPENIGLQRYRAYLEAERDRLWTGVQSVWNVIGGAEFRTRLATLIAGL
jgi:inorganic triphosphatase YgiF